VRELKDALAKGGVDLTGSSEKSELVQLARVHALTLPAAAPPVGSCIFNTFLYFISIHACIHVFYVYVSAPVNVFLRERARKLEMTRNELKRDRLRFSSIHPLQFICTSREATPSRKLEMN
jgi:hypothetical protein